jgi:hypothetical protein
MRVIACLLCLVSLPIWVTAQFSPKERKAIADGLSAVALTDTDLSFSRRGLTPPFALNLPGLLLDKPLEGTELSMAFHAKADRSIASLLRIALEEGFAEPSGEASSNESGSAVVQISAAVQIPEELRGTVANLIAAIANCNASIREAVGRLSQEEKRSLIESLPQWAAIGTELKFEFVSKPRLSRTELYDLLAKVELGRIRKASLRLAKVIEEELPIIRAASASGWAGNALFTQSGVVVELSGVGNDSHKATNSHLCIDLGGANRYAGRYGAGIGYTSVMIDFGNETQAEVIDASAGVGILGVGFAYFMGPKPDLYGKNLAYGSGLAGVGAVYIEQPFRMDSRSLGQGLGVFGIGLMSASKGTDSMKLGYLGQGAAIGGGLGWLYDPSGNDRYRVGGIVIENADRKVSISRAQGYTGILPGGIGMLTDADGSDLYEIGVEGQGCAVGFGSASLYDFQGDDTYIAQRRAQAFGVDEGAAGLYELGGDDVFAVRESECHGFGAERAVAVFIDRQGDDLITARQSQPGYAQEGSFALFLDGGGADRYAGPVGIGTKVSERLGVGLFLELGGDDRYVDGPMNGTISLHGSGGVAASFGLSSDNGEIKPIAPGSLQATPVEIDAHWLQVIASGPKATASSRQLIGIGLPAFKRFCEAFAAESNPTARRVAALILTQFGAAKSVIAERAATGNAAARVAFFEIAAYAKVGELRSLIAPALQSEATRLAATKYAAAILAKEALEPISALVLGADALTAQQAVIALCVLGDEKMVSTMEALMNSNDLIIRHAATEFVARYPRGYELGKALLSKTDEKSQLLGVDLLSMCKDGEALRLCGAGLNSGLNSVRIRAMTVLNGRVPEAYRKRIVELMSDSNPIVAAVARGIDLGR